MDFWWANSQHYADSGLTGVGIWVNYSWAYSMNVQLKKIIQVRDLR